MSVEHIKYYLRAVKRYEEDNYCFEWVIKYLNNDDSALPKLYCEGEAYLPSFILLKRLKKHLISNFSYDNELKIFLEEVISLSKLFYKELIELSIKSQSDMVNFDCEFQNNIQPLGQKVINLLRNIKYKLLKTQARQILLEVKRDVTINRKFCLNPSYLLRIINSIFHKYIFMFLYEGSLLQTSNHHFMKKIYYFITITTTISIWLIDYIYIPNFKNLTSFTFSNLVMSLSIVIISIIAYPIVEFEKIDISGKNIIAYKYKIFFNHFIRKKREKVFIGVKI